MSHGGVSCGHGRSSPSSALQISISVAVMDCHRPEGVPGPMVVIHQRASNSPIGRKPLHIVGACDISTTTLCSSACACMRLQ